MDAKALARSKRSHSQHLNKKHNPQVSKGPAKKSSDKQVGEKSHRAQGGGALPSNWDRYDDEQDLSSEDPSIDSSGKTSDVVLPKSKGADYSYLISQAQSQSESSLDGFPSLDDVFSGFNLGVGSMLAVKGKNILSWTGDDNFIVEDKATTSHEASFLSINLNAVAEQLEKAELSQRLFIEEDILPSDMVKLSKGSNQKSGELQAVEENNSTSQISCPTNSEKVTKQISEMSLLDTFTSSRVSPSSLNKPLTQNGKHEKGQLDEIGHGKNLDSRTQIDINVEIQREEQSRFEAAAAEAELDMLLDSFGENKFVDSFNFREKYSSRLGPSTVSKSDLHSIKTPSTSIGLDDDLDDLLRETSKTGDLHSIKTPLDDDLDDFLRETSKNGASRQQEIKTPPFNVQPSTSISSSKPKVLNDFDSWLDTI
ncbi:hypothetical protein RJ641_017548 [Dillenia turbinata]|uniref:Uncharacterized protein n=1 Tax=Dillenia turbinata TaxID=194707 RepID=A0AAN8YZS7_9MAGN